MNHKPTQEQIKEFWEWYSAPIGESLDGRKVYRPIDLNNLFEYAVPKWIGLRCEELHISEETAYKILFDLWYEKLLELSERPSTMFYVIYPALALFWVLWKIKEEENET